MLQSVQQCLLQPPDRLIGVSSPAECAHWFDKPAFYRPLVEGADPLPTLHANTHLAQVRWAAVVGNRAAPPVYY